MAPSRPAASGCAASPPGWVAWLSISTTLATGSVAACGSDAELVRAPAPSTTAAGGAGAMDGPGGGGGHGGGASGGAGDGGSGGGDCVPQEIGGAAPGHPGAWPDSPTPFCIDLHVILDPCPGSGEVYFGQDGCYLIDVPSYNITPKTVFDPITGLMWQRKPPPQPKTWLDAAAYCETLVLGGHQDWRLPSRLELLSLFDYGRFAPPLPL